MNSGWVKLYKDLEHKEIYKKPNHMRLLIHLMLKASYQETTTFIKGKEVILPIGSVVTGRKKLSQELNIPESNIERCIKYLVENDFIKAKRHPRVTIIMVNQREDQDSEMSVEKKSGQKSDRSRTEVGQKSDRSLDRSRTEVLDPIYTQKEEVSEEDRTEIGQKFGQKSSKNRTEVGQKSDSIIRSKKKEKKKYLFSPPNVEEIKMATEEFCEKKGWTNFNVEELSERFFYFYESKGWIVGKSKMKSWKGALSGWIVRSGYKEEVNGKKKSLEELARELEEEERKYGTLYR